MGDLGMKGKAKAWIRTVVGILAYFAVISFLLMPFVAGF